MSKKAKVLHYDDTRNASGIISDVDSRTMYLYGDIDTETSVSFMKEVLFLCKSNKEPITLFINSSGGNLSDGFSIIDTIQAIDAPVFGVANGLCCSAATLVLTACKRSLCTARTFFLIHELSQTGSESARYREAEEEAKIMKRMMTTMLDMYAAKTKTSRDDIQNDLERTRWMTAQEALAYGLVDEIVTHLPISFPKAKAPKRKKENEIEKE